MAKTETLVGIGGGVLKLDGRLSRDEATQRTREWAERQRDQAQHVLDRCESGELSVHAWRGNERRPLLGEEASSNIGDETGGGSPS